jgi:hypothetical protein
MKQILLTFALALPMLVQAQDAYILKKDGTKIEIQARSIYYSSFGSLKYYLNKEGFRSEKKLDIDDVEKVVTPGAVHVPAKVGGKKLGIMKIIAESADKKFLVNYIPDSSAPYESYTWQVMDKDDKIIETGRFQNLGNRIKGHAEDQKVAATAIKKHFKDCKDMISALQEFQDKGPEIVKFFRDGPTYDCK